MTVRAAAAIALLTLAGSDRAQVIVNGDMDGTANFQMFNTAIPSGWSPSPPSTDLFDATTTFSGFAWQSSAGGGTFVHACGFPSFPEGVGQLVTGLTPGADYAICFEQTPAKSMDSDAPWGFWRVTFGTDVQDAPPLTMPPLGTSIPWQTEILTFTATAPSQFLSFEAYSSPLSPPGEYCRLGLDSVQVKNATCASVPGFEFVSLGIPPNPSALLPGLSGPPLIGATWDPVIDHTSFMPSAILDLYGFSLLPANIPLPPLGTILCSPPLFTLSKPAGIPLDLLIPGDCNLVDVRLCVSGASLDAGGTVLLTNAIEVVLGAP